MTETLRFADDKLWLLDQRRLPRAVEFVVCASVEEVGAAIRAMVVRGAPAIGVAAAYGMAIAARASAATDGKMLCADLDAAGARLLATRPTAVNLAWAVRRMQAFAGARSAAEVGALRAALLEEARRMHVEDVEANRAMGRHGAALLADGDRVLTHCNAGALATAGFGTALGVIRAAVEQGKRIAVFADETRPFLQGARLTAWELHQEGIPVTVIADNMAGHVLRTQGVKAVIVGADRIARNGDVANKIGTYGVAVLARENGVPFYVAAPLSTFDPGTASGEMIPIEERDPGELTGLGEGRQVPEGVAVYNPAFDVTPARYVTAIITEKGIARPPFEAALLAQLG